MEQAEQYAYVFAKNEIIDEFDKFYPNYLKNTKEGQRLLKEYNSNFRVTGREIARVGIERFLEAYQKGKVINYNNINLEDSGFSNEMKVAIKHQLKISHYNNKQAIKNFLLKGINLRDNYDRYYSVYNEDIGAQIYNLGKAEKLDLYRKVGAEDSLRFASQEVKDSIIQINKELMILDSDNANVMVEIRSKMLDDHKEFELIYDNQDVISIRQDEETDEIKIKYSKKIAPPFLPGDEDRKAEIEPLAAKYFSNQENMNKLNSLFKVIRKDYKEYYSQRNS